MISRTKLLPQGYDVLLRLMRNQLGLIIPYEKNSLQTDQGQGEVQRLGAQVSLTAPSEGRNLPAAVRKRGCRLLRSGSPLSKAPGV